MAGDASAYAALGLPPGADSADVEQAYRRLIKEHHPDRAGGDSRRAAEINRAYRELRAQPGLKDSLELIDDDASAPRRGAGWIAVALLVALAGFTAMLTGGRLKPILEALASGKAPVALPHDGRNSVADPMEQPLHLESIDESARDALQMARTRDEMALASASSDCHRALRSRPSVVQLDRCAAFDDAVVQLEDRDPMRDQGPFSELAVTGRILSAASALSDDSVAIDARLDRIRLRVEIALAPFVDASKPSAPGPG